MGRSGSTVALPTVASNGAAATPPSGEAENPAKMGRSGSTVALPLEVGTRVMCQWRDQKPRPLQVNRRLDEWVKLEQLDLGTVENDLDEKVSDKRKCDLKHPPGDEIYRSGSLSMFEWI
ncbi:MOZ/SAS family [Musa troglodytarum]|uniref:MOZ/SAS family n=1 Tax=Musa troglodytarum TaxID=320322 RepID=A0A9E7IJM9_9LILI|nr:MOZ/SAS family [Musa troglodytarum]